MSTPEDVNEIMRTLYGLNPDKKRPVAERRRTNQLPKALSDERNREQNRRRVRRHYKANIALRTLHPQDWDNAVKAAAALEQAEPMVGDACNTTECFGIVGMKEGHRADCPVGKAGQYTYDD